MATLNILEFVEALQLDVALTAPQERLLRAMYGLGMPTDWLASGKTNCLGIKEERVVLLQAGMRSTKSFTMALAMLYEFDRVRKAADVFRKREGLPPETQLWLPVFAATQSASLCGIWSYLKNFIATSSYFAGLGLVVSDRQIDAPEAGVSLVATFPDDPAMRGRLRVASAFEEPASWDAPGDGAELAGYHFSREACAFRATSWPTKCFAVTSASHDGDLGDVLVEEGRRFGSVAFFNLTTFDLNPYITPYHCLVKGDYAKDSVAAARDYENIRPKVV